MSPDSLLVFGQSGIWMSDPDLRNFTDFNAGIDKGIDNWKISNVVRTQDGNLWCAGLFSAYRYNPAKAQWETVELPKNDERISDIALRGGDTLVVMTRSTLYEAVAPTYKFTEHPLRQPEGFENKVTLFKTFWMLHSGDLFGLAGRLVVDFIGIVLVILCVTGIVFFFLPFSIKHNGKKLKAAIAEGSDGKAIKDRMTRQAGWLKWNLKWHNRLGYWLIALTLLLSVTGMCLRPPLMVPLALTKVTPLPGSTLASKNVFHDKLRGLRWDEMRNVWIMSTSEGFFALGPDLKETVPVAIEGAPQVSPMGINVFAVNPDHQEEWLIGSFSGLMRWNPTTGEILDWFTGEAPESRGYGSVAQYAVTGWSNDLRGISTPAVFDYYNAPNVKLPEMPEVLKKQPMSLWNFALELHVGRCYEPFLGSILSVLFVFISGLLLTLTLISGFIIYRRTKK